MSNDVKIENENLKNEILVDISDMKNTIIFNVKIYKDILHIQKPLKIATISLYKIEQKNISIKYYARIFSHNLIN